MNGYGQMIPQNEKALYDALTQFQQMQQKQAMQNELMASGDPYARLGAVLGGAIGNKMGGTSMKDAEAQLLEAQFIRNQEIERARAEQARIQAEAKRAQELSDKAAEREHDLKKIRAQGELPSSKMKELAAAGIKPGSPEYAAIVSRSNAPQTTINNNPGGETASEFQKKLAGKNAEKFNEWEAEAFSANETLAGIDQLKQISEMQKTGRGKEAMAMVTQWLGSEAGANMQSFNSVASSLVLQQAEKLKGAMSDGDIKLLESTMPQFGNDPRANEIIFGVLERASKRAIDRYDQAFAYSQEHGKLQGFKPEFQFSRPAQPAQPQSTNLSSMSDDDILNALKGM